MADDPACAPQVVPAGSGFVDNGQDTDVVRNEGTVDLVTEVVSLVPAGSARRIDEPAPADCPALPYGWANAGGRAAALRRPVWLVTDGLAARSPRRRSEAGALRLQ